MQISSILEYLKVFMGKKSSNALSGGKGQLFDGSDHIFGYKPKASTI